eukprot:tig00021178_g19195.t1
MVLFQMEFTGGSAYDWNIDFALLPSTSSSVACTNGATVGSTTGLLRWTVPSLASCPSGVVEFQVYASPKDSMEANAGVLFTHQLTISRPSSDALPTPAAAAPAAYVAACNITLDMDFATWTEASASQFRERLARELQISSDRIVIRTAVAGSVKLSFEILDRASSASAGA